MARLSNWIVGILNLCSLLLGLAAVAYGVYLLGHGGSACQKSMHAPLLLTGLLVTTISLLGFLGSYGNCNSMLNAYLMVIFFLVVGFVIFAIFALFIASRENPTSGNYELVGKYSRWLEKNFVNDMNWIKIRSCLIDAHVCKRIHMINADSMAPGSYRKTLPPIQLHCCLRPTGCYGADDNNGTREETSSRRRELWFDDEECHRWSNEKERRCFYCKSCKKGVVEEIKKEWRFVAIADVCFAVLFIIIFLVAFSARCSNTPPPPPQAEAHDKPIDI